MRTTLHFGIRCESDLTHRYSECIVDPVNLLNSGLSRRGMNFFSIRQTFAGKLLVGSTVGICSDGLSLTMPTDEARPRPRSLHTNIRGERR